MDSKIKFCSILDTITIGKTACGPNYLLQDDQMYIKCRAIVCEEEIKFDQMMDNLGTLYR